MPPPWCARLACDPTYAKQGEAVASWDGKDATGTVVPSGTYTWTVLGSDADGSALDTDGVSTSITGSIAVTGAVVADKYVALTPARLVDTRSGTGAPKAPVGSGQEIAVQVTGEGGVPTTGVSSVVLNVTAVAPTAGGYATIYPSGTSRPTASNINYAQGATIANQVIVKVGSDGKARLFTSAATNVIVDVAGYYPPGSRYTGLAPARLLDTRTGVGAPKVRIPAGGTVNLQVTGRGGVPTTGAASVAFNITAVNPSAGGYITAWPTGTAKPNASNVNYARAQTIAGLAVAKLGTGGKISVSSSAATDLLLDVAGWFPTSSDFHGTDPTRILDTRLGTGAPAAPVDGGGTVTLQVAGKGGVPGHRRQGRARQRHRCRTDRTGVPHRLPVHRGTPDRIEPQLRQGPVHRQHGRGQARHRRQDQALHLRWHSPHHRRPGVHHELIERPPTLVPGNHGRGRDACSVRAPHGTCSGQGFWAARAAL